MSKQAQVEALEFARLNLQIALDSIEKAREEHRAYHDPTRISEESTLNLGNEIRKLTVDQLRTFWLLNKKRSVKLVAKSLHRDPTSIGRQIRAINQHMAAVAGENLINPPERKGGTISFSKTGERFLIYVEVALAKLLEADHVFKIKNDSH